MSYRTNLKMCWMCMRMLYSRVICMAGAYGKPCVCSER